jgi:hypothetical protein
MGPGLCWKGAYIGEWGMGNVTTFFFFFFENINKSSQWHENMSLSQHTVHIP